MKKIFIALMAIALCLSSETVFSQSKKKKKKEQEAQQKEQEAKKKAEQGKDTTLLGLPGDNLDLYAVLDLFQKSKTIEEFEKTLNEQKTGINNLDLDLNDKVDFIKVITKKKDSSFTFILQVDVSKEEKQDVAVILLDKMKNGKISMQIVGDKLLYGENYVVEPKAGATKSVTPNPGYKGEDPVTVTVPATTVIVEQAPIVQYVYSPAYAPYYPPYYYGYYPPYFAFFTVMAVGIYRSNHYYHHHGYGGYGNTTVINNNNNFNNYNGGDRNTSARVDHHNNSGRYNDASRERTSASTREAGRGSRDGNRGGTSASTRPSTSDRSSNRGSGSTRPSTTPSNRSSSSSRPSTSNYSSGRTRSSGGGGYSGGGGGGGMRSGGGGGGGRRR